MEEYIQVITTTEKREDAEKITSVLVEKRLATCVQILGPILSIYRWKGKIEKVEEYLAIIKTKRSLYKELETYIKKIHPYEVPEIISLPIIDGNKAYLEWLNNELKRPT